MAKNIFSPLFVLYACKDRKIKLTPRILWWEKYFDDQKIALQHNKKIRFESQLKTISTEKQSLNKNITELKTINNIDGYLIGGASQNSKKFIDIIKKTYN